MDEEEAFAAFEAMGETTVRTTAPQWSGKLRTDAYHWLDSRSKAERLRNDASQAEQIRTARTAKNAAIAAAIAAAITVPLAIISIIISVLAWLHPR
jgi:hypothetical protein